MTFEKFVEGGASSPNRSMSEIASALGAIMKGGPISNQTTEIIPQGHGKANLVRYTYRSSGTTGAGQS